MIDEKPLDPEEPAPSDPPTGAGGGGSAPEPSDPPTGAGGGGTARESDPPTGAGGGGR